MCQPELPIAQLLFRMLFLQTPCCFRQECYVCEHRRTAQDVLRAARRYRLDETSPAHRAAAGSDPEHGADAAVVDRWMLSTRLTVNETWKR